MMSAISIEYLFGEVKDGTIGLAYIYCDYKTQDDQTTFMLLSALLRQLLQDQPSVSDLLQTSFKKNVKPPIEALIDQLQATISTYSRVYIIIDALDECRNTDGTRVQLLRGLQHLQSHSNVNLMVTARPLSDIEKEFKLMPSLAIRASEGDIKTFVLGQIPRLPRCI
jgi:hypothetical protein